MVCAPLGANFLAKMAWLTFLVGQSYVSALLSVSFMARVLSGAPLGKYELALWIFRTLEITLET